MGAKLYADSATKTLVITQTPDANDFVYINVQVDVWSDLIEDWQSDLTLRGHTFPVVLVGGETVSAGKLGSTYVLLDPWQIAPYEADHDFTIDGNLFTESALTRLVLPTVGAYTVTVDRELSTLVEVVESGTSGLTPAESQALVDIDTNVDGLVTDVADLEATVVSEMAALEAKLDTLLASQDLTNEQDEAERTTDPATGMLVLRNWTTAHRWEAPIWEDAEKNIPYRGEGLEAADQLVQVQWPHIRYELTALGMSPGFVGVTPYLPAELHDNDDNTWITGTIDGWSQENEAIQGTGILPNDSPNVRWRVRSRGLVTGNAYEPGIPPTNVVWDYATVGPGVPHTEENSIELPAIPDDGEWHETIVELPPSLVELMIANGEARCYFFQKGPTVYVVDDVVWEIAESELWYDDMTTTDLWP